MISESQLQSQVEKIFLETKFPEEPDGLYSPVRYMLDIGGKRLRPTLCLLTYSLYKSGFNDSIIQPAVGLEIFHSFTLIHDDIMDHSTLRRGVDTVWKKWNENTAVLSGDVMCIDSYRRVAMAPASVLPRVLELFSDTATKVCEGQQLDMDYEDLDSVSMAEYMKMIGLKTGVLMACAAKMGALIGGASEQDCESLYRYGYNLGLAFQIADDWLDSYGDQAVFGKPIGGDIVNNKKSWLTTRAQEKASDPNLLSEITAMSAESVGEKEAKIQKMHKIYSSLGVSEDAVAEIALYTDKALNHAGEVCSGVKYEVLRRFALKLVGRAK